MLNVLLLGHTDLKARQYLRPESLYIVVLILLTIEIFGYMQKDTVQAVKMLFKISFKAR